MQVLKPGEAIMDELNGAGTVLKAGELFTMLDIDDPFEHLTGLDKLSAQLSAGAVPMRNKQGIFKPSKITVATLMAHRIAPPPALVVQFNNRGEKTTFPMGLQ